jgi:hypothetical protein
MKKNKYTDHFKALAASRDDKKRQIERAAEKRTKPLQPGEVQLSEPRSERDFFRVPTDIINTWDTTVWTTNATTTATTTTTVGYSQLQNFLYDRIGTQTGRTSSGIGNRVFTPLGIEMEAKRKIRTPEEIEKAAKLARLQQLREAWHIRNRSTIQDKLNTVKSKWNVGGKFSTSIEPDLLEAIYRDRDFKTKTTEYRVKTGEFLLYNILIARLDEHHCVRTVHFPIFRTPREINLFRLRLRQIGLKCMATKGGTQLHFDGVKYNLVPGQTFNIPAQFCVSCLPSGYLPLKYSKLRSMEQTSLKLHFRDVCFHQDDKLVVYPTDQYIKFYEYKGYTINLLLVRADSILRVALIANPPDTKMKQVRAEASLGFTLEHMELPHVIEGLRRDVDRRLDRETEAFARATMLEQLNRNTSQGIFDLAGLRDGTISEALRRVEGAPAPAPRRSAILNRPPAEYAPTPYEADINRAIENIQRSEDARFYQTVLENEARRNR